MRYLIVLLVLLPVGINAQNIGIYIDTSGRVAIGHDTVWEPFQVFTETAGNSMQLDQQSGEAGNTSGLLITPTVSAGQSLTCGLTGELHTISLRMSTVDIFESSTLQITVRDGDQPTDPILTAAEFTVSDENLAWYDIVLDPGTFVQIGDALFLEVSHVSGDNGVWDWIEATDDYPDGVSWQFAGAWNALTDSDLVFKTYVSATELNEAFAITTSGKTRINNSYILPPSDGAAGQVMVTNGTGVLSWQEITGSGSGTSIEDTDGDTKIQTEETADDDIIRFDMGGVEHFKMDGGHLEVLNTGESVFIGEGAGANDDLSNNANTYVGYQSGFNSTTGFFNTSLGYHSLFSNLNGSDNTAIGTRALYSNFNGLANTAVGRDALYSNSDGLDNTAIGSAALTYNTSGSNNAAIGVASLISNETGSYNTGIGDRAMFSNINGNFNTAIGPYALFSNTTGSYNIAIGNFTLAYNEVENHLIAIGDSALFYNAGQGNTAVGTQTLVTNTAGDFNSAFGYQALRSTTTGGYNAAFGYRSLYLNTFGESNCAFGSEVLRYNTSGSRNTAMGDLSLYFSTIGSDNVAIGRHALYSNRGGNRAVAIGVSAMMFSNDFGNTYTNENVAVGYEALRGSSVPGDNTGNSNTAVGYRTMVENETGSFNTASGTEALRHNVGGDNNTAIGYLGLQSNQHGSFNTAVGAWSLRFNVSGDNNTSIGYRALFDNLGSGNTAIGAFSLEYNFSGTQSTAIGQNALKYSNANFNTATGYDALLSNEDGLRNTAMGHSSLKSNFNGDNNTAVGIFALEFNDSGDNNTALGYSANSNSGDFSNTTGIGYDADPTASNRIHIGNSSVAWIGGQVGWATYSDARFKSQITENVVGLDFINKLRPVTYNIDLDAIQDWKALHYGTRDSAEYDEKYEIESYRFSGFIAQEVETASRELDYEFSGVCPPKNEKDFYALRYAEFVVPLVKAVQELSSENEILKTRNAELTDLIRDLESRVAAIEGKY